MIQIDAEDAKLDLAELIAAAVRGEEVLIAANQLRGHPMVRRVAVQRPARTPQYGSARGMITIADDFDEPLPDFENRATLSHLKSPAMAFRPGE